MAKNSISVEQVTRRCEDLAVAVAGGRFPVRLPNVVAERGVKKLWFQPMLAQAVLGRNLEGFVIGVDVDESQQAQCESVYDAGESPDLLPTPQRFAIAHELAHTFFYDAGDPEEMREVVALRPGGGKTADELLEKCCDELAAAILLPKRILCARVDGKMNDPDIFRNVAAEAGVALQTLLIRCDGIGLFSGVFTPAALLLLRRKQNRWTFVRGFYGRGFSVGVIRSLVGGDSLRLWFNQEKSRLLGGPDREVEIPIAVKTGGGVSGIKWCRVISETSIPNREGDYTVVSVVDTMKDDFS